MEKVWKTINVTMGQAGENTPSFLELDGTFITKPQEIFYLEN